MDEKNSTIKSLLGDTDIYLVDQLMKSRYRQPSKILDAGCGEGRNMHWFLQNKFEIYGVDSNEGFIHLLKEQYPALVPERLLVADIQKTNFPDLYFNHIICSAVLHFARNTLHFKNMLAELLRILKPGGSLFIRMASDIGIENNVESLADGVYHIPDGSTRFLLTRSLLKACMQEFAITFSEPLKTVNVNDIRCMSTLVLQKQ